MAESSLGSIPHKASESSAPLKPQLLKERLLLLTARLLAALPLCVRRALGYGLGFVVGILPIREVTIAQLQMAAFLGRRSRLLVARTFANAGRTVLESLNLQPLLASSSSRVSAPQWPAIESWLQDSRPLVALTGHTGNWDLLAAYTISRGVPLTTVGREAKSPAVQEILRGIRDGYGIETIWRSDRSGVKRLLSCMRERRTVAALIDQDTYVESAYVPFFGEQARTPSALIELGQKCNARFISAFMFRTGWGRFETFIEEINSSLTTEEILTEYNQRLAELLRRFPDQWVWFHKRWRSRPSGEKLSSREYLRWLREKTNR